MEPLRLILDTDMDTDCDDAGALAIVHHFSEIGLCSLKGVICDVPYIEAAVCTKLLNKYYSSSEIPIGLLRMTDGERSEAHCKYDDFRKGIPEHRRYNRLFPLWLNHIPEKYDKSFPDSTSIYRKVLADSPDGSIVICAIGLMSALGKLLESGPDDISPLSGRELVAGKVDKLVTMAVLEYQRESPEEFNWRMDLPSALKVLEQWPTRIVLSSSGWSILTGSALMKETKNTNPLNFIYRTYLQGVGSSRPSWDQTAVLYALGRTDLFDIRWGSRPVYDKQKDVFEWKNDPGNTFGYAVPKLSDEDMAALIEKMMRYK